MLLTLSVEKYTYGTSIDKLLVRKWNIVWLRQIRLAIM